MSTVVLLDMLVLARLLLAVALLLLLRAGRGGAGGWAVPCPLCGVHRQSWLCRAQRRVNSPWHMALPAPLSSATGEGAVWLTCRQCSALVLAVRLVVQNFRDQTTAPSSHFTIWLGASWVAKSGLGRPRPGRHGGRVVVGSPW